MPFKNIFSKDCISRSLSTKYQISIREKAQAEKSKKEKKKIFQSTKRIQWIWKFFAVNWNSLRNTKDFKRFFLKMVAKLFGEWKFLADEQKINSVWLFCVQKINLSRKWKFVELNYFFDSIKTFSTWKSIKKTLKVQKSFLFNASMLFNVSVLSVLLTLWKENWCFKFKRFQM